MHDTVLEIESFKGVMPELLAQLAAIDGYAQHDVLYRVLDPGRTLLENHRDVRGFGILLNSCSVAFKTMIKSVRVEIPGSVFYITRHLRVFVHDVLPALQTLQIYFGSRDRANNSNELADNELEDNESSWLRQVELFLESAEDGNIKVVVENGNGLENRLKVHPRAMLRRGWKRMNARGYILEAFEFRQLNLVGLQNFCARCKKLEWAECMVESAG